MNMKIYWITSFGFLSGYVFCFSAAIYGQSGPINTESKDTLEEMSFADGSLFETKYSSTPLSEQHNNTERYFKNPRNSYQCSCGVSKVSSYRITGGREAGVNEFPWMVMIFEKIQSTLHPQCGGVFISDRHVITAAHCVENFQSDPVNLLRVIIGDHDVTRRDETYHIKRKIKQIVIHPHYNRATLAFNVAILELYSWFNIDQSKTINLICFPVPSLNYYIGKVGVIAGWGMTSPTGPPSTVLLNGFVKIITYSQCVNTVGSIPEPTFCVLGVGQSTAACQLDSGGPLMIKEGDKYQFVGIMNDRSGCGDPSKPDVYTSIPDVLDWIKTQLNKDGAVYCQDN